MQIIKLNHADAMRPFAQPVWDLLSAAYANVSGGLLFANIHDLVANTHAWHLVVVDGVVQAVTVHKNRAGQKMVAFAKAKTALAKPALVELISHALQTGWMELSEAAERFVMLECNGQRFIIQAELALHLLQKPEVQTTQNHYHYQRKIQGMLKTKIALGTPNFALCA